MMPATSSLPAMLAPPLAPDASFDADVAAGFGVTWLGAGRGDLAGCREAPTAVPAWPARR